MILTIAASIMFVVMMVFIVNSDKRRKELRKDTIRISKLFSQSLPTNYTPKYISMYKSQFIIALVTCLIQMAILIASMSITHYMNSSALLWTILWGGWGTYCYIQWMKEKKEEEYGN